MSKENYELLEVDESASDEEITAAYERLKKKYNEEKWQDGEAGNHAARMLEKLDAAYKEIVDERREHKRNTSGASAYDDVADAIRRGEIAEAQTLLDAFNERGAEWHYLQSVVFYKKSWMNESKKQLEIAMQLDPQNEKYRSAYDKLIHRADYKGQTGGATGTDPNATSGDDQMGGNFCANCSAMCSSILCANCLYNLCCGCR